MIDDLRAKAVEQFAALWPATIPMPEPDSVLWEAVTYMLAAFADQVRFAVRQETLTPEMIAEAIQAIHIQDGDLLLIRPDDDAPDLTVHVARVVDKWARAHGLDKRGIVTLVAPKMIAVERMPHDQAVRLLQKIKSKKRRR